MKFIRFFFLIIVLSPFAAVATPSHSSCSHLLSQLFAVGDSMLEWNQRWVDLRDNKNFELWRERIQAYEQNMKAVELEDDLILEHLDSLIQSLILVDQVRFQRRDENGFAETRTYLETQFAKALHGGHKSARIGATIRADWLARKVQTVPFGFDVSVLKESLLETEYFLSRLSHVKNLDHVPFSLVDKTFAVRDLALRLQSNKGPVNSSPTFSDVLKLDLSEWYGQSETVEDREFVNGVAYQALVTYLRLMQVVRDRAGLGDLGLEPFWILKDLERLNFLKFTRLFPFPETYNERMYLVGAETKTEKTIVKTVFKSASLKKDLFESLRPSWREDAIMKHWLSFVSEQEVESLLRSLASESSRVKDLADIYLRAEVGMSLNELMMDQLFRFYYGDLVISALTRLSSEMRDALVSPDLKDLGTPGRLRVAFFSRRPNDLSLSRKTAVGPSLYGEDYALSLRLFPLPISQIVTFWEGQALIAKAHLFLMENSTQNLLVMDAFEIAAQADRGKPLHGILQRHLSQIMHQLESLSQRLERQLILSPVTSTAFMGNFFGKLPLWKDQRMLATSHFEVNAQEEVPVRSFELRQERPTRPQKRAEWTTRWGIRILQ